MTHIKKYAFNALLVFAFIGVLGLGVTGWLDRIPLADDGELEGAQKVSLAIFRTLRAFVFGDEYTFPAKFGGDWRIITAGWLGALVAIGTIIKAAAKLFYGPLARLRADWRNGHVVVLGDREFAQKAAQALAANGRKVSHHSGLVEVEHDGVLTVPRRHMLEDSFMSCSLRNAERIVVAETSDSATAETCLRLAKEWPQTPIFAVFENPWLAETIRHAKDNTGDLLITVSESAISARTALVPLPPFLLAQKHEQKRIHVLIVGLDQLGEALIEELLNSNLVLGQKTPRITVLDRDITPRQAAFEARHPHLISQSEISTHGPIDISFVQGDAGALEAGQLEVLRSALALDPVTAVYMAVGETNTPLALALSLRGTAQREGLFSAPILVPAREGCGIDKGGPNGLNDKDGIYAFGGWDDIILASGMLDKEPDAIARSYHVSYTNVVWGEDVANVSWATLSEPFRLSNRRAIAHIPAKLASLGFDLKAHLENPQSLSLNVRPKITYDGSLYKSHQECESIARLEHERWMMDRWLNGWQQGAGSDGKKCPAKKLHPDLIPYDELDDYAKGKDIDFARWLDDWLVPDVDQP
jgi:hypothetical protein